MQAQKYSIKDWAIDDRPREKLLGKGPAYLSDSELLAILLRDGTRNRSAVDLAKDLLTLCRNDVRELGKMGVRDYMKVRGIGEAKAIIISAALELGKRRQATATPVRYSARSSNDIACYIQSLLGEHRHESFGVFFLNRSNKIKHHEIISNGGITATIVDPRIVFKKALAEDAVSIILFHNHPSGNLRPSRADRELTSKLVQAGGLFDIRVLDHIIVSEEGYFSFADEGLL